MSNDIFLRGGCQHCAGHLEFPASATGGTAPCPHCGQITRLEAFTTPESAPKAIRGGKWWLWVLVVVLAIIVGAAGGAALFLVQAERGVVSSTSAPVPATQTNTV